MASSTSLSPKMRLGAVLHVYKGEWGLPSIDFECLRALCLVKFSRCPIAIEINANPLRSGAGKLPYLQIGDEKFTSYSQIKQLLDKEGFPIDAKLDIKSKNRSPAYAHWVFAHLHAYYHYFMFVNPRNTDTVRAVYAKRTPFPFNFYYPAKYQKQAHDIISVFCNFDTNDKIENHETNDIIVTAKACVNLLSRKLGQKVWFFGNDYSEFDAIVYSYLSILCKATLPDNPLENHIKSCQNLVFFINRITKDIFQDQAFSSIKTQRANDPMLTPTERSFLESERKTKLFWGLGTVLAMTAFGAWRGLHNQFLRPKDDRSYPSDDDYDDMLEEGSE